MTTSNSNSQQKNTHFLCQELTTIQTTKMQKTDRTQTNKQQIAKKINNVCGFILSKHRQMNIHSENANTSQKTTKRQKQRGEYHLSNGNTKKCHKYKKGVRRA